LTFSLDFRHERFLVAAARAAACLAHEFTAAEAFIAFDLNDAAAVTDVAFENSLLRSQLTRTLTLVTFRRQRPRALTFATTNFAVTLTSAAYQNRKHRSDLTRQ